MDNGVENPMDTSVVLRVSQAHLDVDACLTWLPSSKIASVWRPGERDRRGKIIDTAGFNVELAEGAAHGAVVQDAVAAFLELAKPVAELVRGGADATVDFGLFLDVNGGSMSLRLAPAAAAVFERAGVTIVFRAYPTSSDKDDED